MSKKSESLILKEIIAALSVSGVPLWRNSSFRKLHEKRNHSGFINGWCATVEKLEFQEASRIYRQAV